MSDAALVSLYVPSLPGGLFQPLILHDGEASPVPELADLESAESFMRSREHLEADRPGAAPAGLIASSDPDCGLIPLPGIEAPIDLAQFEIDSLQRRRTDSGLSPSERPPGAWLALRFPPGKRSVLENLARSHLPTRVREAKDPARWWDWLFVLGGALASHASQVSTILRDPVTGLADRKAFQAVLNDQIERALAESRPLTLLLINPDRFSSINERHGREAGDRCVREISTRLRPALRLNDLVARYGGVVFAAILVDTPEDEALEVAQRVQQQLGSKPYLDGEAELVFSVGLGSLQPLDKEVPPPLEVVRRADQALSAAKRQGGNRVVGWRDTARDQDGDGRDRLSGIFTGNLAKDYRNMALLRDTIDIVALNTGFEALAAQVVEKLYTAFSPDRIGLLAHDDGGELALVYGLTRRDSSSGMQSRVETLDLETFEKEQIAEVVLHQRAREVRRPPAPPDEISDSGRASFFAPLVVGRQALGCLFVEGRDSVLTLDSGDLIFLESLAAQVAVAFDRARLSALERSRQEQERRQLRAELSELRQALQQVKMVYRSPQMEELLATVKRVAPTDATVLITGESGTGKELLARTLHELSPRKGRPFVIVDCGAIASTLIESELFGHERGAYTGAQSRRAGRLAEARDGTVLLDEIGELPLDVQSKLLRFVQDKQFTAVGGTKTQTVDVRIVAATNRDLAAEVTAGRFREDLYHRLHVVCLEIAPLRDRPDDILHLARHYLELYAIQYQKQARQFTAEAEELLLESLWPGNVRELQNMVLQSVILSEGDSIGPSELGSELSAASARARQDSVETPSSVGPDAAPSTGEELWEQLQQQLGLQIEAATSSSPPLHLPLGSWLADDLLLEAAAATGQAARDASALVGMPESTFRRRVRSAAEREESGLAGRTDGWNEIRQVLGRLARSQQPGEGDLFRRTQSLLLEEILSRFPDEVRTGAKLLGVSPPTYRRRVRELG